MSERDWNQPDPSGPSWMSQTDYYTGSGHVLRQDDQPIYVPRRKVRRVPWQVFAGIAVAFLLGGLWDGLRGDNAGIGSFAFAAVFGALAGLRKYQS
jgi:hypothetical protein